MTIWGCPSKGTLCQQAPRLRTLSDLRVICQSASMKEASHLPAARLSSRSHLAQIPTQESSGTETQGSSVKGTGRVGSTDLLRGGRVEQGEGPVSLSIQSKYPTARSLSFPRTGLGKEDWLGHGWLFLWEVLKKHAQEQPGRISQLHSLSQVGTGN